MPLPLPPPIITLCPPPAGPFSGWSRCCSRRSSGSSRPKRVTRRTRRCRRGCSSSASSSRCCCRRPSASSITSCSGRSGPTGGGGKGKDQGRRAARSPSEVLRYSAAASSRGRAGQGTHPARWESQNHRLPPRDGSPTTQWMDGGHGRTDGVLLMARCAPLPPPRLRGASAWLAGRQAGYKPPRPRSHRQSHQTSFCRGGPCPGGAGSGSSSSNHMAYYYCALQLLCMVAPQSIICWGQEEWAQP